MSDRPGSEDHAKQFKYLKIEKFKKSKKINSIFLIFFPEFLKEPLVPVGVTNRD
jgi:hypothetical protein